MVANRNKWFLISEWLLFFCLYTMNGCEPRVFARTTRCRFYLKVVYVLMSVFHSSFPLALIFASSLFFLPAFFNTWFPSKVCLWVGVGEASSEELGAQEVEGRFVSTHNLKQVLRRASNGAEAVFGEWTYDRQERFCREVYLRKIYNNIIIFKAHFRT